MSKQRKIKSYSRIYHRRSCTRKKLIRISMFVLIFAALLFVGYSVAGPFMDYINGNMKPSSSSSESSLSSISSSVSSSEESSSSTAQSNTQLKAATLTIETASNDQALSAFLDSAKQTGATAVVIPLKDTTGLLHYKSTVAQAAEYGAIAPDALDIAPIVTAIKGSGLIPIAKLSAFMDKTAPNTSRDNIYLYESTNSSWWDNAVNKGGKPWLNPYKPAACNYLLAIQNELVDAGFGSILWYKVEFPEVRTLSSCNMGPESNGVTQQQALNAFITGAQTAAKSKNATVYVSYPISSVFGLNQQWFGGDPSALTIENPAPELDLTTFGGNLTIDNAAVDFADMNTALNTILTSYKTKVPSTAVLMPVITDQSIMAKEDIISVLAGLSIPEYVTP